MWYLRYICVWYSQYVDFLVPLCWHTSIHEWCGGSHAKVCCEFWVLNLPKGNLSKMMTLKVTRTSGGSETVIWPCNHKSIEYSPLFVFFGGISTPNVRIAHNWSYRPMLISRHHWPPGTTNQIRCQWLVQNTAWACTCPACHRPYLVKPLDSQKPRARTIDHINLV